MNVWEAIIDALRAEGVEYVFGLPGGDLFYDALYDAPEIKPVLVREESSGPFMAMAYARLTGRPGVCYGSPGPGVANLVPGVMEAHSACIPIIAIGSAAYLASTGMGAFQEVDQLSIMKPVTKWSESITLAERVPWVMRRAFALAANGRPGPATSSSVGTAIWLSAGACTRMSSTKVAPATCGAPGRRPRTRC